MNASTRYRLACLVRGTPLLGPVAQWAFRRFEILRRCAGFPGSAQYWEARYDAGGDSGAGSYGKFAEFKAEIINRFVSENGIESVIEFGCGDGNQLSLARYPKYVGFDVSRSAVDRCRARFASDRSKSFHLVDEYVGETAALGLSLDVVFHLVEDDVFDRYMRLLFDASRQIVIIYSSNSDDNRGLEHTHLRHRPFSAWVQRHASEWRLVDHIPNRFPWRGDPLDGSFSDFYIYEKSTG